MNPLDRVKYPTFNDIGPPLDAAGLPLPDQITDETPIKTLRKREKELDQLINDSPVPNPALHRQRGILYARMEKFARAMEDLDIAIRYGI